MDIDHAFAERVQNSSSNVFHDPLVRPASVQVCSTGTVMIFVLFIFILFYYYFFFYQWDTLVEIFHSQVRMEYAA
jgi:predicted PurR-regulated permease PerM